jgi:hypothetical protein
MLFCRSRNTTKREKKTSMLVLSDKILVELFLIFRAKSAKVELGY